MSFNTDLKELIIFAAQKNYPNESCGLIITRGKKSVCVECENVSESPANQFLISHEEYARLSEQGDVVGVWHTHVDTLPNPSEADLVGCEASHMPWFILSIYKNEVGEFSFSGINKIEPTGYEADYLQRPYVFGSMDCWTLVQDYYRREFEIELDNFPRIHKFWANGHDFFGENWNKQGFNLVTDESYQVGDLFLMGTDNTGKANHIGIYIGNEMMLHHAHGRLSCRDIYGGYWHKHTQFHIRHKSKC